MTVRSFFRSLFSLCDFPSARMKPHRLKPVPIKPQSGQVWQRFLTAKDAYYTLKSSNPLQP
jgi:hypothetical protein